jgi:hypothetical protein
MDCSKGGLESSNGCCLPRCLHAYHARGGSAYCAYAAAPWVRVCIGKVQAMLKPPGRKGCHAHQPQWLFMQAIPCPAHPIASCWMCAGTNAGLIAAAAAFGSSLEELDVSVCGGAVTDTGVEAVAVGCPNLRSIDLSSSAVTEKVGEPGLSSHHLPWPLVPLPAMLQIIFGPHCPTTCPTSLQGLKVLLSRCRQLDGVLLSSCRGLDRTLRHQIADAAIAQSSQRESATPASVLRRLLRC